MAIHPIITEATQNHKCQTHGGSSERITNVVRICLCENVAGFHHPADQHWQSTISNNQPKCYIKLFFSHFISVILPLSSGFDNFEKLLSGAHWMVGTSPPLRCEKNMSLSWREDTEYMKVNKYPAVCCRTTTFAQLLWIRTLPSCWLCWASGTSTSSMLRTMPCCHTTSTCTASLHTSNRCASQASTGTFRR